MTEVEIFYRAFNMYSFRVINRFIYDKEIAKEINQDVWLIVFRKIHQWDRKNSFITWLHTIARNQSYNYYTRKSRRHLKEAKIYFEVFPEKVIDPDHNIDAREKIEELNKAVNRLGEKQRATFIKRVCEDKSFQEIADEMGCKYDTAKANYRHALMRVRGE